jgi:hypothetical protein
MVPTYLENYRMILSSATTKLLDFRLFQLIGKPREGEGHPIFVESEISEYFVNIRNYTIGKSDQCGVGALGNESVNNLKDYDKADYRFENRPDHDSKEQGSQDSKADLPWRVLCTLFGRAPLIFLNILGFLIHRQPPECCWDVRNREFPM